MQDNAEIYASTTRPHPTDAPVLISQTRFPLLTHTDDVILPPSHPHPHPTSGPSMQPSVAEGDPQEDVQG
ncbi:hypothetical protein NQZ68_032433 [Dissostichus eleginoides]|nr:hypothetical protein NQZ68_032433 [Dissostichus eleginoides]